MGLFIVGNARYYSNGCHYSYSNMKRLHTLHHQPALGVKSGYVVILQYVVDIDIDTHPLPQ